jgi:glycerol kinase
VLAIDQGTTGSTALLLDPSLRVLATHNVEFPNHYPQPGHVEHDPEEIWASVGQAVEGAVSAAGVSVGQIAAIGITNQRETSLFWDRKTGQPIHRALVWQDRRTADRCQALKDAGNESFVKRRTGLVLDPYFSGTKAAWLLDNVPGARAAADPADALVRHHRHLAHLAALRRPRHRPVQRQPHLMFDLHTWTWNDELLELLNVPRACCRAWAESEMVGHTRGVGFLPDGIPVAGSSATSRARCSVRPASTQGMAKCTYGTGAFVLLNTGARRSQRQRHVDDGGLAVGGQHTYASKAAAFVAGAAVQWLRDGLGIIKSAARSRPRRERAGQRRRHLRARAHRPRRAPLAPGRARVCLRHHPGHHPRPPRPGRARRRRAADRRHPARDVHGPRRAAWPSCASTAAPRRTTC